MAINWKDILGDAYTEDLEKAINTAVDKDYILKTAVGKDFVSKADFNAKVKQIGEHEKTIQSQTTELDNLRKTNVDAAAMQKQIDELKAAHAAEIDQLVKRQIAYNEALKAGAIDPEMVVLLMEPKLADAPLSEDRKTVDGLSDALQALVEGKGTAGMFSKKDGTQLEIDGAEPAHPGNKGGTDKVDLNNGTYSQYIAAHPNN